MLLGSWLEYARKHFTSTDTAFKEILKRLEKMPDGFKKTAIAQDIFSKNASRLMRLSASDLKKLGDEADRIGMTISKSTYKMAAAYHDQMDKIEARLTGMKRIISYSLVKPLDAASKTALEFADNAFGRTTQQKMLIFGKVGSNAIKSIIYGLGFVKDTAAGVELVIDAIKIAFYGLADVMALALEPPMRTINTMIKAYNYIAQKLGKSPINFKLVSSIPDINKHIIDIKNDMATLTHSLHDGRDAANDFTKIYEKNLKTVAKESKETKKSIDDTNGSLSNQINLAKKQISTNKKIQSAFLQLTGTPYEKWLNDANNKMIELSKGNLSTKDLMKAWDALNKNNPNNKQQKKDTNPIPTASLSLWRDYYKQIGDMQTAWLVSPERNNAFNNGILLGLSGDSLTSYVDNYKENFLKPLSNLSKTTTNTMADMWKAVGQTMQSSMMSFFDYTSKGFMNFGTLAENVLHQVYMQIVKMQVVSPLVNSIMGGVTSYFSPRNVAPNTALFGSKIGVMGEAGAEAIMPLQRHNGVLGVKSTPSNVVINVKNESGIPMNFEKIAQAQTNDGQVIDIVMKHLNYDQDFRTAIKGA